MTDRDVMEASAEERLELIAESYRRLTGEQLVADSENLWDAPRAIVAHGTQDPPLFFYGNALALDLFRMDAASFIRLPSYRSAEPQLREERAAMLAKLDARNIVRDYRGIRIAADGTRFRIDNAVVWNLLDAAGQRRGQAATFAEWTPIAG